MRIHERQAIGDETTEDSAKWIENRKQSDSHQHIKIRVDTTSSREVENGSVRKNALEEHNLVRVKPGTVVRPQDRPAQPVLVRKDSDHLQDLALARNGAGSSPNKVVVQLSEPQGHVGKPRLAGVVIHQQLRVLLDDITWLVRVFHGQGYQMVRPTSLTFRREPHGRLLCVRLVACCVLLGGDDRTRRQPCQLVRNRLTYCSYPSRSLPPSIGVLLLGGSPWANSTSWPLRRA